ncbi:uncharacterized protein [Ambystoma mexicanum]|uniref:uncharacterized protein isoform X2 n=1 Tax=Ambystoma mexicanum TaxID=8296 RepID=UPI0037E733C5
MCQHSRRPIVYGRLMNTVHHDQVNGWRVSFKRTNNFVVQMRGFGPQSKSEKARVFRFTHGSLLPFLQRSSAPDVKYSGSILPETWAGGKRHLLRCASISTCTPIFTRICLDQGRLSPGRPKQRADKEKGISCSNQEDPWTKPLLRQQDKGCAEHGMAVLCRWSPCGET